MLIQIKKITEVSAYQAFQVLRMTSVILISIILVKSGFNKEEVSSYELFIFLANLFSFFWVMGIKNATLSYFPKLALKSQKSFFINLFLALQFIGLVFAIILFLTTGGSFLQNNFIQSHPERIILAVYIFLYAPTVLIELVFILQKKSAVLIRYGIFIHLIQVVSILLTAWLSDQVFSLFLVLMVWMMIKWLYTIFIVIKESEFDFSLKQIRIFLIFSIPLILHILMGNGMEFLDGLLVNEFFSPELFAIYRYGARELPIVMVLIGALSSGIIPVAVKDITNSTSEIKKRTRRLMHFFYPTAIVLIFLSPFLYTFFYSAQYIESARLFNIYLLIISSRIILVEVFIYATHKNKVLMYVSFGELMLNLILSIVLLQIFGLEGIAIASVIAFMSSKLFLIWFVKKHISISLKSYLDIKIYLLYSAGLYLSFILSYLF